MELINLAIGMVVKNYKEMCKLLGEDVKTGGAKQNQLKYWSEYFKFHKEVNKFIIDEIYEKEVKDKIDKRKNGNNNIDYIQYIEKLILDLLVQSYHKESVCLSKNKLLKELKMINDSYSFCKIRIPKLSKFTKIQQETIDEWYSSSGTTLQGNLEKALNNLKSQSLIFWSNEISVCKINLQTAKGSYNINRNASLDEYDEEVIRFKVNAHISQDFREATDNEKKVIMYTEREIMKELGFDNKAEIVKFGMWNVFKEKVNKIIFKKLEINFYYNSYKILFNHEHILEKYEEFLDDLLLSTEERKETQQLLNKAVIERINNNSVSRQNRALNKTKNTFGKIKDKKLARRTNITYVKDNEKLTETLINTDSKNIKNIIRKIKIEKKK